MRDWGYDPEIGQSVTKRIIPEDVAKYANKDSRALSKVTDDDLLDELQVRLFEYATLPADELAECMRDILFKYDEVIESR